MFEDLNNKFSSRYIFNRDIIIDESLMMCKGRLGWIQYIPLKRARFSIKLYLLCESKSGYLFLAIIYTGKGSLISDTHNNFPMPSQIDLSLMEPLLNMGYCPTTDNLYTSSKLSNFLIRHKTEWYGTMQMNRQEVPAEIQRKNLKRRNYCIPKRNSYAIEMERQKRQKRTEMEI